MASNFDGRRDPVKSSDAPEFPNKLLGALAGGRIFG
jgi:hypothetical protein